MKYKPYPYQDHATQHIIDKPGAGLFLEMGLGKTVATLTAIDRLMYGDLEVSKVLVIAPKRVADEVWTTEAHKWDHLKHLTIAKVLGTERQRIAALRSKADIYVINRENVVWLVGFYGTAFPFDMVVIDELSSFKAADSRRFKTLRTIRPKVNRVVGLTGTPAPNGLLDLWPQIYLLDMGQRLGPTLTGYRKKYFEPGNRNGYIVYDYTLKQEDELLGKGIYEQEIYDNISDICISMKAEDYLQLPQRIDRTVEVHLPAKIQEQYDQFERDQILALQDIDTITVPNAAALTNKLLQYSNGAIYDADKAWHEVHREKIEALEEILDTASGQPVLVFYSYKHDLERIQKQLKKYKPIALKESATIKAWNDGKIQLLIAHPASAGHGLNLQAGGSIIVWFGLPWSLELYQQANARLHRQGQVHNVIIHHLVCPGTMDVDVMESLANKASGQDSLMQAVKARIEKYTMKKTG